MFPFKLTEMQFFTILFLLDYIIILQTSKGHRCTNMRKKVRMDCAPNTLYTTESTTFESIMESARPLKREKKNNNKKKELSTTHSWGVSIPNAKLILSGCTYINHFLLDGIKSQETVPNEDKSNKKESPIILKSDKRIIENVENHFSLDQ